MTYEILLGRGGQLLCLVYNTTSMSRVNLYFWLLLEQKTVLPVIISRRMLQTCIQAVIRMAHVYALEVSGATTSAMLHEDTCAAQSGLGPSYPIMQRARTVP